MKKTLIVWSILAFSAIGLFTFATTWVTKSPLWQYSKQQKSQSQYWYLQNNHNRDMMNQIMTTWSYQDFLNASSGSKMAEIINTQAKFEKLKQAHNLSEQARKIRDELWLNNFEWKRMWKTWIRNKWPMNAEMLEVIKNKDWKNFQEIVKNTPLSETINTQAKFEKFVQMHDFLQSNDMENAEKIRTELGLKSWRWQYKNWNLENTSRIAK